MTVSQNGVLISNEATVSTAGTAVALASAQVRSVTIIAKRANTGAIYVGGSDVDNTVNDGLIAGESITFSPSMTFDLDQVFIDADTNGEGIDFYAVKA